MEGSGKSTDRSGIDSVGDGRILLLKFGFCIFQSTCCSFFKMPKKIVNQVAAAQLGEDV